MTTGNKSDRVIEDHYLWAIKNNEVVEYSGARNAEGIEAFIEEQCGV